MMSESINIQHVITADSLCVKSREGSVILKPAAGSSASTCTIQSAPNSDTVTVHTLPTTSQVLVGRDSYDALTHKKLISPTITTSKESGAPKLVFNIANDTTIRIDKPRTGELPGVVTLPSCTDTIALTSLPQTFTNKSIHAPAIFTADSRKTVTFDITGVNPSSNTTLSFSPSIAKCTLSFPTETTDIVGTNVHQNLSNKHLDCITTYFYNPYNLQSRLGIKLDPAASGTLFLGASNKTTKTINIPDSHDGDTIVAQTAPALLRNKTIDLASTKFTQNNSTLQTQIGADLQLKFNNTEPCVLEFPRTSGTVLGDTDPCLVKNKCFDASSFALQSADSSSRLTIHVPGVVPATTVFRLTSTQDTTLTFPSASDNIIGEKTVSELANKTLIRPVIDMIAVKSGSTLSLPAVSADDALISASSQNVLSNKILDSTCDISATTFRGHIECKSLKFSAINDVEFPAKLSAKDATLGDTFLKSASTLRLNVTESATLNDLSCDNITCNKDITAKSVTTSKITAAGITAGQFSASNTEASIGVPLTASSISATSVVASGNISAAGAAFRGDIFAKKASLDAVTCSNLVTENITTRAITTYDVNAKDISASSLDINGAIMQTLEAPVCFRGAVTAANISTTDTAQTSKFAGSLSASSAQFTDIAGADGRFMIGADGAAQFGQLSIANMNCAGDLSIKGSITAKNITGVNIACDNLGVSAEMSCRQAHVGETLKCQSVACDDVNASNSIIAEQITAKSLNTSMFAANHITAITSDSDKITAKNASVDTISADTISAKNMTVGSVTATESNFDTITTKGITTNNLSAITVNSSKIIAGKNIVSDIKTILAGDCAIAGTTTAQALNCADMSAASVTVPILAAKAISADTVAISSKLTLGKITTDATTGSASFGGNVIIAGTTKLADAEAAGNVTVMGKLSCVDNAQIAGTLAARNINANGIVNIAGIDTKGNSLNVTSGSIAVTGAGHNINVGSTTLYQTGDASFGGNIALGGGKITSNNDVTIAVGTPSASSNSFAIKTPSANLLTITENPAGSTRLNLPFMKASRMVFTDENKNLVSGAPIETGVAAGTYDAPTLSIDRYGRITSAANKIVNVDVNAAVRRLVNVVNSGGGDRKPAFIWGREIFDATNVDSSCQKYVASVFDGRYVYFIPASFISGILRYDTTAVFTSVASYKVISLPAGSFSYAVFDGANIYCIGSNVVKYDIAADTSAELAIKHPTHAVAGKRCICAAVGPNIVDMLSGKIFLTAREDIKQVLVGDEIYYRTASGIGNSRKFVELANCTSIHYFWNVVIAIVSSPSGASTMKIDVFSSQTTTLNLPASTLTSPPIAYFVGNNAIVATDNSIVQVKKYPAGDFDVEPLIASADAPTHVTAIMFDGESLYFANDVDGTIVRM